MNFKAFTFIYKCRRWKKRQSVHHCQRPTAPETVNKQLGKSSNHR